MSAFHLFFSVDPSLGRLDYSLLSDQSLMEMLVGGLSKTVKKLFQDDSEMFLDVCDWDGVQCDNNANVTSVRIDECDGPIALEFIPPRVGVFHMRAGSLSGTLSTSALPKGMEYFAISTNNFGGTVDFTSLPEGMRLLCLQRNKFSGSAALDSLPSALERLYIQQNHFSGSLNLKNLPPNLHYLDASTNAFTGVFRIENLPERLSAISASINIFDEVAVVPSNCTGISLSDSGVTRVVDEEGKEHPAQDEILG